MVGIAVNIAEAPEHSGFEPEVKAIDTNAVFVLLNDTGSDAIPLATTTS